jgi:uncharacterized protein (TIGR00369 family)
MFEKHINFNMVIGIKVESVNPAEPRMRFSMRDELRGHALLPRLHGGVTASVLDVVGGFGLICALAERHRDESLAQILPRFSKLSTIDLRVDYLREAIGEHFIASAKILRLGGRIGAVQMSLSNDQNVLVAAGSGSYVVS